MIDPHVHLRDWSQAGKETLRHGFSVAYRAGLDGVFEMPNTDPPLVTRDAILRRIDDADAARRALGIPIFHGLYAGLTAVPRQIEEAVRAWKELFPRVVGLKMYAGHSTGQMGVVDPGEQALVYRTLAALEFTGVLAVHCEKEGLLRPTEWDPARPVSHARARPPAAEVASVDDQKRFARAARFRGTLHVCHISTPWALDLLRGRHEESAPKEPPGCRVTCGLTPHHALLDANMMEEGEGILLKVNPPLRPLPVPALMLQRLLDGDIDWIETDHAPHTRRDKLEDFASGFPGFGFYPRFLNLLSQRGLAPARIRELTHDAVCRAFGVDIRPTGRKPESGLQKEYEFDAFRAGGLD
ncbi:MAG: dihydroorotase [Spirochaetia bacterium]|jgi:dihydroorotase